MNIPEEAREGLRASGAVRWRFWERTALNLKEAEQAIDRISHSEPTPEQAAVLKMASIAASSEVEPGQRLTVLREAMSRLTQRVAGDLSGMAAIALALKEPVPRSLQKDHQLVECLPDTGLLGKVAPTDDWLLHSAAQVAPRNGQEWAEKLKGCPRASVQAALNELCDDETKGWLQELKDHAGLEQIERKALALTDQTLPAHQWALQVDESVAVATWGLGKAPEHEWKTLAQKLPGIDRMALLRVDAPFDPQQAAELLAGHPDAARRLAEVRPRDAALQLVARLPEQPKALAHYAEGSLTPASVLGKMLSTIPPDVTLRNIETTDPLLGALLAQTWSRPDAQAKLAVAGYQATEKPGASTASIGLAMARATGDLNEKLWAARAALKACDCPARDTFLQLTELNGTNETWCRAALALASLRAIEKNPQAGTRSVVEVVLEAGTTWAGPAWRETMSDFLGATLAESQDPMSQALARKLREHANQQVLVELTQVLDDRILRNEKADVAIGERGNQVLVGGVRLDKKVGSVPLNDLQASAPEPEVTPVALQLDAPPEPGIQVGGEWKEAYKSGIGGVYNPTTGEMEWKESYKSGVAGIYDPDTGKVEWQESYKSGVAVLRMPNGKIEWKESYKSGIVGVLQPDGTASWPEGYKDGVARCQRPDGSWVVKTDYKTGIAGVWDEAKGEVDWHTSYNSGIAYGSSDPEKPTLATTASVSMGWDDDD